MSNGHAFRASGEPFDTGDAGSGMQGPWLTR